MKKTTIYLDMDGTIADLYNINNWLESLIQEKDGLFLQCKKLISQEALLTLFPQDLYDIRILSMTPKNASEDYCKRVIEEKNEWLDKNFPLLTKRIYKKYGYNKNLKNSSQAILIDDNAKIRESFRGVAIMPFWV